MNMSPNVQNLELFCWPLFLCTTNLICDVFKKVSFASFLLPVLTVQVINFEWSFTSKPITWKSIAPQKTFVCTRKKMLLDHEAPFIVLINSSSLIFFKNTTLLSWVMLILMNLPMIIYFKVVLQWASLWVSMLNFLLQKLLKTLRFESLAHLYLTLCIKYKESLLLML